MANNGITSKQTKEFLQDLQKIVEIESYSLNPDGINAVGDFFRSRFRDLGWKTEDVFFDKQAGKLLKVCNREAERYDVTLIGHMDTVYPCGTMALQPFQIRDGVLFGQGVGDMKQGDLAMLYIAKALSAEISDKLNICMLFTPDEEIGSPYSKAYQCEIAKKSDRIFVMEACLLDGSYCYQRKGRTNYTVSFYGKAGHAGFMFEIDHASAVLELAKWTCALMGLANRETGTTVNVAPIRGGVTPNTIADFAELRCEVRYNSEEERLRIQETVMRMKEDPFVPGVCVKVTQEDKKAWNPSPETIAFADRLEQIARSLGQPYKMGSRGGLSDANIVAEYCPIVIDGMGPRGGHGHCSDEQMDISGVDDCITLCVELLKNIAEKTQF